MALSVTSKCVDQVAEITLAGELIESTVSLFQAELVKVAEHEPKRLVLYLSELEFMASAGVRALLLIKQQLMPWQVDIYAIAPQEQFRDVIERAVPHHNFIIRSEYKP